MNEAPQSLVEIVKEAVTANTADITAAQKQAEKAIRKLPNFAELSNWLISHAILELCYDARHSSNVSTKRQMNYYKGSGKVQQASETVREAYRNIMDYYIAGTTIGNLTGEMLPAIYEAEIERGNGHIANARFVNWLQSRGLPAKVKVRDFGLSEKVLRQNFKRILREVREAA